MLAAPPSPATLLTAEGGVVDVVATFTDTNLSDTASAFTATIDWGDGTTTVGVVSGSNGAFTVSGGHSYADEGSYALRTTITTSGTMVPLDGSVTVAESDKLAAQPVLIEATQNAQFSAVVATFSDSDSGQVAGDFTATIDWGDGTTTGGAVGGSNGAFTVSGSHSYGIAGLIPVKVTVADDGAGTATASTTGAAQVGPPAPLVLIDPVLVSFAGLIGSTLTSLVGSVFATTQSATEGVALAAGTAVAAFADTNAADTQANFIALINWGDGTTTVGTVSLAGSQSPLPGVQVSAFVVSGSHTYGDEGSFPVSVGIIRTTDNASGTIQGSASGQPAIATAVTVADADRLTPVPLGPLVANPNTYSGVVAQFTDANVNSVAGDFTASIDWGDGTGLASATIMTTTGRSRCPARTAMRRPGSSTSAWRWPTMRLAPPVPRCSAKPSLGCRCPAR